MRREGDRPPGIPSSPVEAVEKDAGEPSKIARAICAARWARRAYDRGIVRENVIVTSAFGGTWLLNPDYFATPETAQWMASKYGTGEVVEQTIYGFGNPYQATTSTQANIKLANGTLVNAGLLACYYQTYAESKFPGLADIMVRHAVDFVS